jgi:transcriptional regulator with XRE-family HTH domain
VSQQNADFSARLQRVMADLNISRRALAHDLGVDRSVIARWLTGVHQPTGHNLSRLTDVVRRHWPDATLDFWRQKLPESVASAAAPARSAAPPAKGGLVVSGLRTPAQPNIDANYAGLWGGFYQSTQNRGAVVLAVMYLWTDPAGLRCVFTEGKVSASGAAIAIGPRLHLILEIDPLHDRLCLFIFNGIGSPDAAAMDGVYAISAGDTVTCAAASPVVMFRIGDAADYVRAGSLAGVMQSIYAINVRNVPHSTSAGDPIAGLRSIIPAEVLRIVCPVVGVAQADGKTDFMLRMPASRSLPSSNFGWTELAATSPILAARRSLRCVLGLDEPVLRLPGTQAVSVVPMTAVSR